MPDSVEVAAELADVLSAGELELLLPQAASVPTVMQAAKAIATVRLTDFFM